MTKEEFFQSLGQLAFAKIGNGFNLESDELDDAKIKEFSAAVQGLFTKDQAISTPEIRKSVMGKTFAGMEESLKAYLTNDPLRKYDAGLLDKIFESDGRTTEKIIQLMKAQNSGFSSELAEIKNKSGASEAGNEVLKKEFENRGKLLEEKIKAYEALEAKLAEKDNALKKEAVRNYAALHLQGKKINAPNDTVKEALQSIIYSQILDGADFDIETDPLGQRSFKLLTKGSTEPLFDTKTSQPLSMQQYIDGIAAPYLSFSEEPTKVIVNNQDPTVDALKNEPKNERERAVQESINAAIKKASIPS